MDALSRRARELLDRTLQKGAGAAEVLLRAEDSRELRGSVRRAASVPTHRLKVFVRAVGPEGREGTAFATARSDSEALATVDTAVQRIARGEPNPHAGPIGRLDAAQRGLGIDDPRRPMVDDEARRECLEMNDEALVGVKGVSADPFVYEETVSRRVYLSSRGIEHREIGTHYRLGGSLRLIADPSVEVSGEVVSRHFADVASVPLGASLARRAEGLTAKVEAPGGDVALVLEPRVLGKLLPAVLPAFDAELVARGRSFLSKRDDQRIGSPRVHIIDDATVSGGLQTRSFDDRGVPPVPVPLVREGVASALYLSPEDARVRDSRATGHCSAEGGVWIGNVVLRPGSRTRNMLFPDLGRFVIVEDLLDGAVVDVATGRLELPCRLQLAEAAGPLGHIGDRVLRTTIWELFGALDDVCSDHERHGPVDACTWILSGVGVPEA